MVGDMIQGSSASFMTPRMLCTEDMVTPINPTSHYSQIENDYNHLVGQENADLVQGLEETKNPSKLIEIKIGGDQQFLDPVENVKKQKQEVDRQTAVDYLEKYKIAQPTEFKPVLGQSSTRKPAAMKSPFKKLKPTKVAPSAPPVSPQRRQADLDMSMILKSNRRKFMVLPKTGHYL